MEVTIKIENGKIYINYEFPIPPHKTAMSIGSGIFAILTSYVDSLEVWNETDPEEGTSLGTKL